MNTITELFTQQTRTNIINQENDDIININYGKKKKKKQKEQKYSSNQEILDPPNQEEAVLPNQVEKKVSYDYIQLLTRFYQQIPIRESTNPITDDMKDCLKIIIEYNFKKRLNIIKNIGLRLLHSMSYKSELAFEQLRRYILKELKPVFANFDGFDLIVKSKKKINLVTINNLFINFMFNMIRCSSCRKYNTTLTNHSSVLLLLKCNKCSSERNVQKIKLEI
jgi:translation initiation factor 2 beta subunit (eIF-2beta)/eIF-5